MRIIKIVIAVCLLFTLTACQKVEITPGIINVVFDDLRWEDEKIVSDIYVTNGKEDNVFVESMEFALYLPDGDVEVCSAGFDTLTDVRGQSYVKFEIEFTSEFISVTESELEELGYSLDDLDMHFWYMSDEE